MCAPHAAGICHMPVTLHWFAVALNFGCSFHTVTAVDLVWASSCLYIGPLLSFSSTAPSPCSVSPPSLGFLSTNFSTGGTIGLVVYASYHSSLSDNVFCLYTGSVKKSTNLSDVSPNFSKASTTELQRSKNYKSYFAIYFYSSACCTSSCC